MPTHHALRMLGSVRHAATAAALAGLALSLESCSASVADVGAGAAAPTPTPTSVTRPDTSESAATTPTTIAPPAAPDIASPAPPSPTSTASTSAPTEIAAPDVFGGAREVRLAVANESGAYLSAALSGRATVARSPGEGTLFVLTRKGSDVVIASARTGADGRRSCLTVKDIDPSMPEVLWAQPCAQDRNQLFTFMAQPSANGARTYAIRNDSAGFVQWSQDPKFALYVQELGDAELDTRFTVQDRGEAQPLD